ncbi:NADH-quinone oxidoreductase subunit C [Streptomyces sp. NPDC058855]|uniref:NADH-quinone oxidoreductase subunit C n=1 Tax=Streptomyces sp. NPDC058855 TaxID=3346651 RepID=UPI003694B8D5
MNRYDSLPEAVTDLFGDEAAAERAYDLLTVDVPVTDWLDALRTARDELGCTYFDWLSAVDEPGTGFRVCAHVVALRDGAAPQRLLVRTTVPHGDPVLPTAVGVFAGAAWHERETHEMFGVRFEGHPHLVPLLLPENFEGHPLRKDFVLAARVAKAWPGAKEPGESHDGGPKRRQMLPPGVPDPNEWGPLKGQLPPAPTRADRPARRTRTATEGSASQAAEAAAPRRARSASAEPAGQPAPRRTRSASDGSASQAAAAPPAAPRPRPRSADAPWHHARPAFDTPTEDAEPTAGATPAAEPAGAAGGAATTPDTRPEPEAPAAEQPQDPAEGAAPGATPAEPQPPAEGAAPPEPEGEPRRSTPRTDENDTDGGDPA